MLDISISNSMNALAYAVIKMVLLWLILPMFGSALIFHYLLRIKGRPLALMIGVVMIISLSLYVKYGIPSSSVEVQQKVIGQ